MEFIKKGMVSTKYLSDGCEFKKDKNNYVLVSTSNEKYEPFIGKSYGENVWDMIAMSDVTHGPKHTVLYRLILDHYKTGNRMFDKDANILLKKDEKVIYKMNNIRLNEPKSVRVTNSAHYGTSHRRGKRSTGIGVSKSVGESHDVIKNVDVGEMVITNKRFVFSGAKRSVDVNISQITGVTPYDNGIKLQRKSKQKAEYFVGVDNYFFTYEFDGAKYFFTFNGNLVKAMIEGGLNKTPQQSKLIKAQNNLKNKAKVESQKKIEKPSDSRIFCPNCGVNIDANSNFCMECGYKIK